MGSWGRELLHTRGRLRTRPAMTVPSYKAMKERTKIFFLEQLPALNITATGEPNTDFCLEYPALTELLEQPNTFHAVKLSEPLFFH